MLGLRTVLVEVPDLDAAKRWYSEVLGFGPYFDMPFYVGFNVGGYELGLRPHEGELSRDANLVAYWGVDDMPAAWERLLSLGATPLEEPKDVGDGVIAASVRDPFGNAIGLLVNPHFDPGATT